MKHLDQESRCFFVYREAATVLMVLMVLTVLTVLMVLMVLTVRTKCIE